MAVGIHFLSDYHHENTLSLCAICTRQFRYWLPLYVFAIVYIYSSPLIQSCRCSAFRSGVGCDAILHQIYLLDEMNDFPLILRILINSQLILLNNINFTSKSFSSIVSSGSDSIKVWHVRYCIC